MVKEEVFTFPHAFLVDSWEFPGVQREFPGLPPPWKTPHSQPKGTGSEPGVPVDSL